MNRVFKQQPRRRHALKALILASSVLASPALAQSLPSGGQVVSGSATIAGSGGTMTIDQHSDRLIANWQDFSIGSGERVVFNQPDARSVALNRVIGQNPSQILGTLSANGQVFLVNPNGVAIGKGAQVQTGGFVASTLGISDADFLAGTYRFGGTGGGIVNEGDLSGKIVALIAPAVTNAGTIRGDAALAAGSDVLLDFGGDGLISVEVKASTLATLVENKGLIRADGGLAVLTAKGASDATKALVNNSGTIEARTIGTRNGRILLLGDMQSGAVHAGGTLDASAPVGGDGGFVEASAAKVTIDPAARITTAAASGATGRFLIDPNDYRIAASGGDITGAALGTLLASNNVILASADGATSGNGDIFVNDSVSWSANTLTLSAVRNIEINAAMHASGTAGLALQYGQGAVAAGNGAEYLVRAKVDLASTGSFSTRLGSDGATVDYTILTSLGAEGSVTGTDLQGINGALTGDFVLGTDIDASATASWNAGQGWASIGGGALSGYPIFSGRFDGLGHIVSNLALNRPGASGLNAGLFGYSTGTIQNVNLRDASITGNARVGAVIGNNNGLAAWVSATGTVTASVGVGGVAGVSAGIVRDSHSGANIVGTSVTGGLVGGNQNLVTRSYSDGTVTVTGDNSGGLVGSNNGTIADSYSTAAVSGGNNVGGLVGQSSGPISGSYASGAVSGTSSLGGLIGRSNNNIDTSYWDVTTTGVAVACGSGGGICTATGLTTNQALNYASYSNFGTWASCGVGVCTSNGTWFMTDRTRPMLSTEWRSTITNLHELQIAGRWVERSYTLASDLHFETINAGSSRGNLWATGSSGGNGFATLSSAAAPFTGSFDGDGHVISGLLILASGGGTGLFGTTGTSAILRDFSLTGVVVEGPTQVGMVVGLNAGLIDNVHAQGSINASGTRVGGIAGFNSGTIRDSSADVVLSGGNGTVGGLVGQNQGTVTESYTAGSVTGSGSSVGGLVGQNQGTVSVSFSTASVSALSSAGGLVGNNNGMILYSYATGAVLVTTSGGGGLAGTNTGQVVESYASGAVSGPGALVGGLIGSNGAPGIVTLGAWNSETSGQALAIGSDLGTSTTFGGTTAQMRDPFRYIDKGWHFAGIWATPKAGGMPILRTLSNGVPYYAYYARFSGTPSRAYGDVVDLSGITRTGAGANNVDYAWGSAAGPTANAGSHALGDPGVLALTYNVGSASDYYVTYSGALTVTPRVLNLSGGRSYDGTANVDAGILTLGNLANGDTLVLSGTGAMADKHVGTGKTFALGTLGLGDGAGLASNYTLAGGTGSVDIARAEISAVTGISAASRVYDRTTAATLDSSGAVFAGMAAGDDLAVATASGAFADKNAGAGKTVNITGIGLGGGDAGNYTLASTVATATADITPATISAITGITAASRTYDGTTAATLDTSGAAFTGILAGDALSVTTATGAFADKNAGTGKSVNITGLTLGGSDAANYTLTTTTATASADIARSAISAVTGIRADSRAYDRTTAATLDSTGAIFGGMIAGDDLSVATASGAFADKDAGDGKTVNITGTSLGGGDAGNYVLVSTTATATADITPATISAITGIIAASRTYDGTTAATLDTSGAAFTGIIAGDALSVTTATGAFADKNAGTGKTVNITGLTLGGTDAANYTLAASTATTSADIARATISAVSGIRADSRAYDRTTAATLDSTGAVFAGMVAGDSLSVATTIGAFTDRNAGVGKTVNITGISLGGSDAANYVLASAVATATADITPATISAITGIIAASRVYDRTTAATLDSTGAIFAGMIAGDDLAVATASGAFANKDAGAGKTVNITAISLGGSDAGNYVLVSTTATASADITPATISAITDITAASRTYDGTTAAALDTSGATFTGILAGDALSVAAATGAFADKNAGTGKTVNITGLTLGGTDAANYTLAASTATTSADIARATISAVSGIRADSRAYDRTTAATLDSTGAIFAGMIAGDNLSVATASGAFIDRNAGVGKTVNITGISLGGGDAGNYVLASTVATATADITPATISAIAGITAASRTYDGTTGATLDTSGAAFTGMLAGDALSVATVTGAFADKNAGTGKTVNITGLTLGGGDAANYTLTTTTATASADIARAAISAVTGIRADSRAYDRTTVATLDSTGAVFAGMVAGDDLSVATAIGAFADKNAGDGKTVNITSISLAGSDARNYTLASTTATAPADITPATISAITGITAASRTYDGTTAAALDTSGATFTGILAGDVLSVATATGAFADKHAGTGKTVNITGLTLGGSDAANYALGASTATTSADIARATISAVSGIVAASRGYDRTTTATLDSAGAIFAGMIAGDDLSVATAAGAFADKNAGAGKTVNITAISLGGGDADNYVLAATVATAAADITRATIAAVTGITALDRTYDGTTAAALDTSGAAFTGMLTGDTLGVASATGSFADKNAGTGKTVNVTGISLGGADAGNYTLASTIATLTANVTPATISAITGITAASRTYDGTTAAALDTSAASFAGLIAGDRLVVATATGSFADKNAANGKTVNIVGLGLGGADAGNYVLASTIAAATADIRRATIAAVTGISVMDKTYDGTLDATLNAGAANFTGMIRGDDLRVATAIGTFADRNTGSAKTVHISGIRLGGDDAGNYVLAASTADASADIAQATISGITGITAAGRIYDGTTDATLDLSQASFIGIVAGDELALSGATGHFADENAGTGKTVWVTGLALGGADASNYRLAATSATTHADIARATISAVTGVAAAGRVYDGTTEVTLDTSAARFAGMVAGDDLSVTGIGSFADKNAGIGKAVNIAGLTLGGRDAGNYSLATTAMTAKADIAPATIGAITGIVAASRVYEGTTVATLDAGRAGFGGLIAGDSLTVATATGAFADKNVGIGKIVTITGLTLGGADARNYTLRAPIASTRADITAAQVTLSGVLVEGKTYDGTTAATVLSAGTLSGYVDGDQLGFSHAGAVFADKNAGTGKAVTLTGIALTGADAGNYRIDATAPTTADISQAVISAVTGIVARDKLFDATTNAMLDLADVRFAGAIAGDRLTVAAAAAHFADPMPGLAKPVSVSGLALGGADATNYVLASDTANVFANILLPETRLLPEQLGEGREPRFEGPTATILEDPSILIEDVHALPQASEAPPLR